ncbi:phosphopantothenoylcysteine decarboxylase [Candidatus Omnitrophota bacterium]
MTAGPTLEPIDPVRFISNRSTGYMGYKLAECASRRGHIVTLISGPTKLELPRIKKIISISTADDLLKALKKELKNADCLIMCAAVGDFRARSVFKSKIKRQKRILLELVSNKDILKDASRYKKDKLFIGFSLETENLVRNSCEKLKAKRLDLVVANRLTKQRNVFGDNKLDVYIIDRYGCKQEIRHKNKTFIAHVLLDKIEKLWYLKSNQ